jgi:alkylation response protein AidB-like acyl-CoA dehydrogenase
LSGIAERAGRHDITHDWPALDLTELQDAGAMRWSVPAENGGDNLSAFELHLRYEQLATASVATALILTQRDSAVGLIDAATGASRRMELLNQLAKNEIWTTVGIAQLTTSRQGGLPAVTATRVDGGYLLTGTIPWCTGLNHSPLIVIGAALKDGQQILVLLQHDQQGVELGEPMNLVALNCTMTGRIDLKQVFIADDWVLRRPTASALAGRRNSLTLGQTFIATGLTQAALNLIAGHDSDRARAAHDRFAEQLKELRTEIAGLCQVGREADAADANARLRGSCNDLALRVTHAAVALYKGTALLRDHPAQRLAREAMFLLVWSCPNPVIDCTVDLLSGR